MSVGFQGDVKKAQLELAPLRWDSATGHLLLARRLVVVVSFSGVEPEETTRDGIRGRRRRRERRAQTEGGPLARLVTTEQGLHEVRFEDVFSGRRHRTDTLRLRLSRHAEPVAFHVVPDAGRFGPGSKLYFLSEGARANPYGHEAVYELDLSGEGLRMEITSASASGASASYYWSRQEHEENRYYQAGLIDINDAPDLWLWDAFIAPVTKSFPFQITDLAPTTEPARLSVWLQGVSDFEADPDHHLRIYVNGNLVQETSWDGKRSRRVEAEIGPGRPDRRRKPDRDRERGGHRGFVLPGVLWAQENLFNIRRVGSLEPQAQQPLLFAMNCLNGITTSFRSPRQRCGETPHRT